MTSGEEVNALDACGSAEPGHRGRGLNEKCFGLLLALNFGLPGMTSLHAKAQARLW